jgi:alpha-tubulin suppressor-like RCC1 family protein
MRLSQAPSEAITQGMMRTIGRVALITLLVWAGRSYAMTNLPPSPIKQVWGGGRHSIALLSDGSVWTWGSDVSGKLGNNQVSPSYNVTNNDCFLPQKVHGPGNVGYLSSMVAISAGEGHNMALKSDGTVWMWGWNGLGQLGNGTTNDAHTPVQVSGMSNVVAISGRGYHCLALKSDGTVWAWGWNAWGQLGDGKTDAPLTPVQVVGLTNPASISAGYTVSVALMSNGTVQVWGTGPYGELGQGNFGDHSYTPITVKGLSNVVSVSAGFQNPEALKSDGTIWMWGYGGWGQLGNGGTNNTSLPGRVLNLTNMIFAGPTGDRDNCAIGADHTVWTWGRNYNGQLGVGTASQVFQMVPTNVPAFGSSYAVMVQTPDWHTLALQADGTLWGWGINDHGQLGNNTTNEADSPTPVLWPDVVPPPPGAITIKSATKLANGSIQLTFTNNPGALFTVLAATNPSLSTAAWNPLGSATETPPGQYQFTDSQALNNPMRFYRVRSP